MKKLLLVDGHSLIHRAYHAYPKILSTGSGELTNAVYGFTNMLLTAISEIEPTHVAVAFDLPKPTFREAMFVGYKQSRVKPDDDMIVQIPRIKEVVQTLNIPIFEVAGYEADDVIGTLCREATKTDQPINRSTDNRVIILTSDRDLMQLIVDDVVMIKMPVRGKKQANRLRSDLVESQGPTFSSDLWNEDRFIAEWGFKPDLLPDYKAFAGDQSDDIPGVGGVGEKTGRLLVSTFGSVDEVYKKLHIAPTQTQSSKLKVQNYNSKLKVTETLIRKLAEDQESAQMSKKLATIDTGVPIELDWKATEVHEYDKEQVLTLFEELRFKSLIHKLPNDAFEQHVQEELFS